jgi:hypothetical protein
MTGNSGKLSMYLMSGEEAGEYSTLNVKNVVNLKK